MIVSHVFVTHNACSLQLFASEAVLNPYTGKYNRESKEMLLREDNVKARHFKKFALDNLPNLVERVDEEEVRW